MAGEYNLLLDWNTISPSNDSTKSKLNDTGNGWLVMANYKFTPVVAATVRYSGNKFSKLDEDTEVTLAPSFQASPNWLLVAEGKYEIDLKKVDYALESTFSF